MGLRDWIGRTESRADTVTAAPIQALSATLDRDDPIPQPGDPLPLLWHWLFFLPLPRQSALGIDGHERLGLFLPPVPLPRRLYAGGRLEVHHSLRVGDSVQRVSRIVDINEKAGRSGPLVFVKVRHEISGPGGLALVEDHDIVYRGFADNAEDAGRGSAARRRSGRDDAEPVPNDVATWQREILLDEVLLFRYSALTFNGYRIHYDRRYATEVQGYPGLVVHAPLVATLLADLLCRHLPDAIVSTFSFRAHRPLFDGDRVVLCGSPDLVRFAQGRSVLLPPSREAVRRTAVALAEAGQADLTGPAETGHDEAMETALDSGAVKLWALGADGAVAMDAVATLASGKRHNGVSRR